MVVFLAWFPTFLHYDIRWLSINISLLFYPQAFFSMNILYCKLYSLLFQHRNKILITAKHTFCFQHVKQLFCMCHAVHVLCHIDVLSVSVDSAALKLPCVVQFGPTCREKRLHWR